MQNMGLIILLSTLISILFVNCEIVPLNFEQAISRFHSSKLYHESINFNKMFDFEQAFAEIANMESFGREVSFSSDECLEQFMNFTVELKNKTKWALQGIFIKLLKDFSHKYALRIY